VRSAEEFDEVRHKRPGENCPEVSLYSKHWPCYFPQHGKGLKHLRRIALAPWQRAIVDREPEELICAALDALGIHWRRSTKYIVSVYRKADTARLDEFVGPKDRAVPWTNVHYTA
jgi:hypothetical protein